MELPQPQDGSAVHEAIQLDEVDNTPSIEEDDIISSIEYDGIMPTIITFNDAYTIESDNDSEFEEIERCVTSDNELLNDEHADEPRSSLRSHTVPLESWKTDVQSCQVNGLTLYAGGTMTVSFDNGGQVEYLTILYLRQDLLDKEDVTLVGRRFLKTNHPDFGGSLDTNLKDEVAWVACDYPGRKLGHLFEVPSESVIEQRQIVMTNALTPSGSNGTWNIHEDIVCRWKVVLYYPKATRCKPKQSVVRKLQAAECNTQWYVPKDEIQIYSRGETVKGGSLYGWRPFEPARLSEESRNRQLFAAPFAIQAVQPTTNQSGHVTIILDDDSDNDILEVTVTAGSSHQDRRESSRQRGMTRLQRRRLARRMLSHSRHFLANERRIRSVATHIGASRQDHYERFRQLKTTRVQRLSSAPQSLSSILAAGEPRRASNNSVAGQAHPDTSLVQRYTFGDAFCGGGGVSRGAQMAGLAVAWGFDRGPDQCQTWSTNFPYAEIFHCDVTAFLGAKIDVKIDILHLSPPCQPYSSANTRPNEKKDEANIAACFAISDLIEKCKPRLVTMENTSGLFDRKPEWFHRFINLFLARDYSVRWSLLDMANYGVPQSRQRLIIIAAGYVSL